MSRADATEDELARQLADRACKRADANRAGQAAGLGDQAGARCGAGGRDGHSPRLCQAGPAARDGGNSRNGYQAKTVPTDVGAVQIEVPRDQDGSFEPQLRPSGSGGWPGSLTW